MNIIRSLAAAGLAALLLQHVVAAELVKPACVGKATVCLYDDGSVLAWDLVNLKPNERLAAAVRALEPTGIDADEGSFWIYDGHRIVELKDGAVVGEPAPVAEARDAPLLNFLRNDSGAYAVYAWAIVDLLRDQRHAVPELGGQLEVKSLRPLCYAKGPHTLWIGTGQGEWGGHLVRFDTERGTWESNYDGLHYVTGIALIGDSPKLVSWSMSHFYAHTVLRVHHDDTSIETSFEVHEQAYYQTTAYSPFDERFYVVEQRLLETVDPHGKTTKWAELPEMRYKPEGMAIGVVPGVHSIVPIARDMVMVFFFQGPPVLVHNGKVLRFAERADAHPSS